ncbi:MAG: ABC transporter ATP-binding protein [Firmicutes bacterium]|nr:ABC transporter ATP-binding protein [Bacillota bacterium]
MLKVDDIRVNYGGIEAVKGISFDVRDKEIVTLIGSNGAGKTSTLRAISNLVRKSGGRVTFMDMDITRMEPSRIVKLGVCHVPEGRHIFPFLTVEENLIAGDLGNTDSKPNRLKANMEMVFELFPRLKERRRQNGGTLSGGEQQMLAIGRGLMLDPKLMMLDEPSLGLAPILVDQIFDLIVKIRATGKTILLVEQNASMALEVADRAFVLETGSIAIEGRAAELANDPRVISAYLGMAK